MLKAFFSVELVLHVILSVVMFGSLTTSSRVVGVEGLPSD